MTYNASAYPSGMRNRKANTGKNKGKTYTFDECKDVPIDDVPMSKFPVVTNVDFPETDVYMSDETQPITSTEGKMLGAAASSTEVDRSGSVAAPGMDEAKRRRIMPHSRMQDLFGSTLDILKQIIASDSGCMNCMSGDHKTEDCPNEGAVECRRNIVKK